MSHLWIQRTTLPLFLLVLARALLRHTVLFTETLSPASGWLADRIVKPSARRLRIEFVTTQMGDQNEAGEVLFYELEARLSDLTRHIPFSDDIAWLPGSYRAQESMWRSLLRAHYLEATRPRLAFLIYMVNQYRTNAVATEGVDRVLAWYSSDALARYTLDHFEPRISIPCRLKGWPSVRGTFAFGVFPGAILFVLVSAFRAALQGKPPANVSTEAIEKGTIFQQLIGPFFDRHQKKSFLFWLEASGLEKERIVLFYNRAGDVFGAKQRSEIERHGFPWVDAITPLRFLDAPIRHTCLTLLRTLSAIPKRFRRVDFWRWAVTSYFVCLVEGHRAMLRTYNVKMLHQTHEFWPQQIALGVACRMEDTLFLWYHWSVNHLPYAWFDQGYGDLLLSWGPLNSAYFEGHGLDYRCLLQTGMIAGDGFEPSDVAAALYLRGRLSSRVTFAVSIFDTSHGGTMWASPEALVRFYEDVLEIVRSHPDWGCLIKSKGVSFETLPKSKALDALLDDLRSERRCLFLDARERVSVVARATDVAVCYSTNTAGIIAALAGGRAVYLDYSGVLYHPLVFSHIHRNLIYHSAKEISDALEQVTTGNQAIGDHGPVLHLFDAFQDGNGPARTGAIIRDFMDRCDSGASMRSALDGIATDYGLRVGRQYVSRPGEKRDHTGTDLWTRSLEASGYPFGGNGYHGRHAVSP